jgi:hypothetical protein
MEKYFDMFWLRKKTREEQIQKRLDSVFSELTSEIEFTFSEIEIVQITNELRRKLNERLLNKKSECYSKGVEYQQKAKEIQNALDFLE